jgi:hypothetical protein
MGISGGFQTITDRPAAPRGSPPLFIEILLCGFLRTSHQLQHRRRRRDTKRASEPIALWPR